MDNSYFIYTDNFTELTINRFHFCQWHYSNDLTYLELGLQFNLPEIRENESLDIFLDVPFKIVKDDVTDLFHQLKLMKNSKFIFNDVVRDSRALNPKNEDLGVVHSYGNRASQIIMPIRHEITDQTIKLNVNVNTIKSSDIDDVPQEVYTRFLVKINKDAILTKKNITSTTIIVDTKVNERRNIPKDLGERLDEINFCKIQQCFHLIIVPNNYETVFLESQYLKNVRNLETDLFKNYIGDHLKIKARLASGFCIERGGLSSN